MRYKKNCSHLLHTITFTERSWIEKQRAFLPVIFTAVQKNKVTSFYTHLNQTNKPKDTENELTCSKLDSTVQQALSKEMNTEVFCILDAAEDDLHIYFSAV